MDPKNDEWAPHLIRKACEDAGKPFYLIDLNRPEYQLNLIDGITAEHLEELLLLDLAWQKKAKPPTSIVSTTAELHALPHN